MREIIVEPMLREKLSELAGQAILCDSEHRALGIFFSIAELEELRKVKTGKPLEEILARLGL